MASNRFPFSLTVIKFVLKTNAEMKLKNRTSCYWMDPRLLTKMIHFLGIRNHSIIQQWWPCDLLECFRFTLNQLTAMLWWFPQSFMVISWFLSDIWPKIGKNHHRGSFNNPTVMAMWLTRKHQHYYELHQKSAQMSSWKFHGHTFSR